MASDFESDQIWCSDSSLNFEWDGLIWFGITNRLSLDFGHAIKHWVFCFIVFSGHFITHTHHTPTFFSTHLLCFCEFLIWQMDLFSLTVKSKYDCNFYSFRFSLVEKTFFLLFSFYSFFFLSFFLYNFLRSFILPFSFFFLLYSLILFCCKQSLKWCSQLGIWTSIN